jgi:hypothetical protein
MRKVVIVVVFFLNVVLLSLLISPQYVLAQWTNDPTINTPIKTDPGGQMAPLIVTDTKGGAIIVWMEIGSLLGQRVDRDGYLLWDPAGVPVCTAVGSAPSIAGLIPDGEGGAIVVWYDFRNADYDTIGFFWSHEIYAQKIDSMGQSQWTLNGVSIAPYVDSIARGELEVTTDGAGGAIVTWTSHEYRFWWNKLEVYIQRVDRDGVLPWGLNGADINDTSWAESTPKITTDMSGGAIIAYATSGGGFVQRVDESGNRLWPIDSISPRAGGGIEIISDGSGGALMVGRESNLNILAQRIDSNGMVLWDTAGVVASTISDNQSFPKITSDLNGGVVIAWSHDIFDFGNIHTQRVDSSGVTRWGADGVVVCSDTAAQVDGVPVTDGSSGSIIYWLDTRYTGLGSNDLFAQRISDTGVVMWDSNGIPISLRGGEQMRSGIISEGSGGAILAWQDVQIAKWDIYGQNVNGDGSLGPVGIEESNDEYRTRNLEFRLFQNQPNPFHRRTMIRYMISKPGPVSLKVYNISGMLVKTLIDEDRAKKGELKIFWDGKDGNGFLVSSGMYFYQLQSRDFQSVRKVILLK